jgi:hypothetical protein
MEIISLGFTIPLTLLLPLLYLAPDITATWGAGNGSNAVVIYKNKIFVSFDIGGNCGNRYFDRVEYRIDRNGPTRNCSQQCYPPQPNFELLFKNKHPSSDLDAKPDAR